VEHELRIDRHKCYLAGSPVDGVAIDTSSAQSIRTFMIPSTLVVLLLCRWCLRSWWLTIAVMVTALFGEVLVLGLVSLCGVTMNAVFTVMVPWFSFLRCLPEFIWLTITYPLKCQHCI